MPPGRAVPHYEYVDPLLSSLWITPVYSELSLAEIMLFGVFHFANPGLDMAAQRNR